MGLGLVLEQWMRRTSSRPLRMFPQCRYGRLLIIFLFSSIINYYFIMLAKSHQAFLLSFHQIYSNREVEEAMTKIRDVLSDDKKDWELRVAAVRRPDLSVILSEHHLRVFPDRLFLLSSSSSS